MIKKLISASVIGVLFFTGCATKEQQKLIRVPPTVKLKDIEKPSFYEDQRKKVLAKVIKQKAMPIKTPDKVLRVLTMPYVDKKHILQTQNFHYITVEKGQWILGEYLLKDGTNSIKELTPLKVKGIKK